MSKKKLFIIILSIGVIFSLILIHFYVERHDKAIRNYPIRYCYQEYSGPPNSVLIIEDEKDIQALIDHYTKLEKQTQDYFEFDLRTLSMYDPVYLISYYGKDSLVAEVVSFNNYGIKFGGAYIKGFVYSKTLHLKPPPK